MVEQIKKRTGDFVPFEQEKIRLAAYKALIAVDQTEEDAFSVSQRVSDIVKTKLEYMLNGVSNPTVEQAQDLVENTLMDLGQNEAAKKYILYRQHHKELRELDDAGEAVFAFAKNLVGNFVGGNDWRAQENANASTGAPTFQGTNSRVAGEIWNTWALHEMYGKQNPEIRILHESGGVKVHDLDFPCIAYCCGHSTRELIGRGFGEVAGRVQSGPAKHLETMVMQIVNYVGTMQAEFAGAQALSSIDTLLAPFVRADNLTQEQVTQCMQMIVHGLNVPSRWGWQAPFSNLTFDLTIPEDLKNEKIGKVMNIDAKRIIDKEQKHIQEKYRGFFGNPEAYLTQRQNELETMLDSTYGDYQREADMINLGFLEIMNGGDKSGRIFTFPIPTYNITKQFDWDSEVAEKLFEVTGKYGIPYFQNYVGSGLDPGDIRAMCCRLNLDQKELINRPGSMWGPGDSTGSIGVVTINMNRIGYEAGSSKEFFEILGHRMDVASESLEIKREIIGTLLDRDFVPYTKSYLGHFDNHFSTIGLCGMNECCMNFFEEDISTERGKAFTIETLNFMRERIKGYQGETGNLYNLEATPAESTSYSFALKDIELYPNIFTSGENAPFLTNSTQLAVDADMNLFEVLAHQNDIQPLYTGGTIFHALLGQRIDGESAKNLVRKIATTTKLPYFSLTPIFSVCEDHGYISGNHEECPTCAKPTERYDRVVGYLRPVNSWNKGKQEEFKHRKRFEI